MLSKDQVVNLFNLLKKLRGNDRWTKERIAIEIGVDPKDKAMMRSLKKHMKRFKSHPELEYLEYSKGYFNAEYPEEFQEISTIYKNRAIGLEEIAVKFHEGKKKAKRHSDQVQLTLNFDDIEENT